MWPANYIYTSFNLPPEQKVSFFQRTKGNRVGRSPGTCEQQQPGALRIDSERHGGSSWHD